MVERRTWEWVGREEEDTIKLQGICICATIITFESLQHPRQQWQTKTEGIRVQHVDSDWSVQRFIKRLGGLEQPRLSAAQVSASDSLICVEEWHEKGDGRFERGSNVFYNDAKAHMSLKSVGWGPEHGKAGQKPPVWIMLYP